MVKHTSSIHEYLKYAGMGIQMVIVMGSCMWVGLQLDRQLELRFPVFLSLLSVGATVFCVYRTIRKLLKQTQQQKSKKKV